MATSARRADHTGVDLTRRVDLEAVHDGDSSSSGREALDRGRVRKYIPELPDYGKRITLRHLLQHTSGIRDQWTLLRMAGWRDDDLITEDDVTWAVTRQRAS